MEQDSSTSNFAEQLNTQFSQLQLTNPELLSFQQIDNFPLDQLKSAAQKSVRLGLVEQAAQWFLLIFRKSPTMYKSAWNRAFVIAVEDIGPANPALIIQLYHLYSNNPTQESNIIKAAVLLAQSTKCRINDWKVVLHPDAYGFLDNNITKPSSKDKEEYSKQLRENNEEKIARLMELESQFRQSFVDGHESLALWCCKAYHSSDKSNVMWGILLDVAKCKGEEEGVINIKGEEEGVINIKEEMKDIKSDNITSTQYITVLMHLDKLKKCPLYAIHAVNLIFNLGFEGLCVDCALDNNIYSSLDVEIKYLMFDEALDKHTLVGRSLGRGLQHFLTVGSRLVNEDATWAELSDVYRSEFIRIKGVK